MDWEKLQTPAFRSFPHEWKSNVEKEKKRLIKKLTNISRDDENSPAVKIMITKSTPAYICMGRYFLIIKMAREMYENPPEMVW